MLTQFPKFLLNQLDSVQQPLTAFMSTRAGISYTHWHVRGKFIYCFQKVRRNGRGDKIRTCDPLVPNQMRYQAAPLPDTEDIGQTSRRFKGYWQDLKLASNFYKPSI